jgi:NusA-like KH domain protein
VTKIKYDNIIMSYISLFESATGTKVHDCIVDEGQIVFIVEEHEIAKAIGRNGSNARRLEALLNRKIKIVEFNPNVLKFIKNFIYPLQADDISEQEGLITITGPDVRTKGLLIGRDSKNLKNLISVVQRYFKVTNIRIA